MTTRITNADLEHYEKLFNEATGNPVDRFTGNKQNPGHVFTQGQYGYFTIERISSEGGAASDLATGLTKRQAYEWYKTALKGIELYQARSSNLST